MSGILSSNLPKELIVDGTRMPIRYDYRSWIRFTCRIFSQTGDDDAKRFLKAIDEVAPGLSLPECSYGTFIRELMNFYRGGKRPNIAGNRVSKNVNALDFDYDSDYIFAAFYQQYGIDLQASEDMHWWTFKALFDGLTDSTQIVKIMQYRTIDLSELKDKHQREFYRKMKEIYAIPIPESIRKRNDELIEILGNSGDLTAYFNTEE